MPAPSASSSRWRGWTTRSERSVTSAPLPKAAVRNRLFPKTRSWFALGFPVELLSPLSVLRILYALLGLLWPAVILAVAPPAPTRAVVLAGAAVALGVLLALLRARAVGITACEGLLAMAVVIVAVVGRSAHADAAGAMYLAMVAPLGAVSGLFLPPRALVVHHLLIAAAVWYAVVPAAGVAVGLVLGLGAATALLGSSGLVALLSRAVHRHDDIDADTGLPNGFGLAARVLAGDSWETYIVVVVSLAGLSDVREALGYQVGTELLRRAVEDLGQVLPPRAVLGRVDGDQLVVLLPMAVAEGGGSDAPAPAGRGATTSGRRHAPIATGESVAATLAEAVSAGRYLVGGIEVSLRAHAGVALAPWDGHDVAGLVRRASLSARRAEAGGQRARGWDGERDAMTADDLALLTELRVAADRRELWLAYQPQLDAGSRQTRSVEALLRWDSPTRGPVGPDRFIPLAERTGLVDRLTDWVLDEALDAQVRWRLQGVDVAVSVNVSAKSLSRPDLPDWVLAKLHARALPPTCLTLEVTETAQAADLVQAVELLRPLRESGVRVSIDDFGTGYTSLAMLPHLPLDELKVDREFVMRSGTSPADEAIVRSICELAHRLGLAAVAEGVEDAGCCARLVEYNFDLLQGYHLARPLAEADLLAFVSGGQGVVGSALARHASLEDHPVKLDTLLVDGAQRHGGR